MLTYNALADTLRPATGRLGTGRERCRANRTRRHRRPAKRIPFRDGRPAGILVCVSRASSLLVGADLPQPGNGRAARGWRVRQTASLDLDAVVQELLAQYRNPDSETVSRFLSVT